MTDEEPEGELERRLDRLARAAQDISDTEKAETIMGEIEKLRAELEPPEPSFISEKPDNFDSLYELITADVVEIYWRSDNIETHKVSGDEVPFFALKIGNKIHIDTGLQVHLEELNSAFREYAREKAIELGADIA